MKVAFVGTSIDLTDDEERDVRQFIAMILKNRYSNSVDIVITGGATGVDSLAFEVARGLFFKTKIYNPKKQQWKYFQQRNLQIAKDCDELHCISIPVRHKRCYHHEEHKLVSVNKHHFGLHICYSFMYQSSKQS